MNSLISLLLSNYYVWPVLKVDIFLVQIFA